MAAITMVMQIAFFLVRETAMRRKPGGVFKSATAMGLVRIGIFSALSASLMFAAYALVPSAMVRLVAAVSNFLASLREDRLRNYSKLAAGDQILLILALAFVFGAGISSLL